MERKHIMFRKPETVKKLAATIHMFKPIDAYLVHHKKVADAFIALEERTENAKRKHEDALTKAGALEAKRLLGEITEEEAQSLDTDLSTIRNEQDRLESAKKALDNQARVLHAQAETQNKNASQALSDLARAVESELDEELREAAAKITSVVNRLYALYDGTSINANKRDIFEMKIPSIIGDKNLFKPPVRLHPRDLYVLDSFWKEDAEAVKLHEKLKELGTTYRIVGNLEREAYNAMRRVRNEERVLPSS